MEPRQLVILSLRDHAREMRKAGWEQEAFEMEVEAERIERLNVSCSSRLESVSGSSGKAI